MSRPNIAAFENDQWFDPVTGEVTYVSVDRSTTNVPQYHWVRNPAHGVKRNFTAHDSMMIAKAFEQSQQANRKIIRGSFQQMVSAPDDVMLAIVDDPDPLVNAEYGGLYYQPDGNMYKVVQLADLLSVLKLPVDSNTTPSDQSTGGTGVEQTLTDVGSYGVKVSLDSIILPAGDTWRIVVTDSNPVTEVYLGPGGVSVLLPDGTYDVTNTTYSYLTPGVVVGGEQPGNVSPPGNASDPGSIIGSYNIKLDGADFYFPDADYYQIELASDHSIVWQGNPTLHTPVTVADGIYDVINITDSTRTDGVLVNANGGWTVVGDYGIQVNGRDIYMPDDQSIFQILVQPSYTEVFQGTGGVVHTVSGAGTYDVRNLTTPAEQTNNIVIA